MTESMERRREHNTAETAGDIGVNGDTTDNGGTTGDTTDEGIGSPTGNSDINNDTAGNSNDNDRIDRTQRRQIGRQIAALAIPTFGQLIADPLFVLIDTAVVGHIGRTALAGLSIGSTVILTAAGLCNFLAYGTTSSVGKLMGAGHRRRGFQAGMDGMWLAFIIGMVVSALLFGFATPICIAMGASGEVLTQAVSYLRAVIFGLPGMLLVYAANGIFRGLEKVRITLVAAVAGAVFNTALDFLFVFGFGWGVAGSGLATFAAQWFMGIFLTVPVLRWARQCGASLKPRLSGIGSVAGDGIPLFVRTLALRVCMVATVVLATHMGTAVLAGYQAVNSSWNFVLNMLDAIGISGQALVAVEIGAGHRRRAKGLTSIAARAGLWGGIAIGVALLAFGALSAPLFSPDPQVQVLIRAGIVVVAVILPLSGWMWALDGILIGAGDYTYLAVTCLTITGVYLPAVLMLGWAQSRWHLDGTVSMVLLWAVFGAVFIGGRSIANGLRTRTDQWIHQISQ